MNLQFKKGTPQERSPQKWYIVRYSDGIIGSCLWRGNSWDDNNVVEYAEYSPNYNLQSIEEFPHCDNKVLHAPGQCEYCDEHPDWQHLRQVWGICFTGEPNPNKIPCPAEQARPLESINKWGGNAPNVKKDSELPF